MNTGWAPCSRGRCSTAEGKASSVSQFLIFPEEVKKLLRLWRWTTLSYKRPSEAIIMLNHLFTWKSSLQKIPVPRTPGLHQLESFGSILGLLGRSMFLCSFWYFYVGFPSGPCASRGFGAKISGAPRTNSGAQKRHRSLFSI